MSSVRLRELVVHVQQETGQSERKTCGALERPRSTQRYIRRRRDDEEKLVAAIHEHVRKHPLLVNGSKITKRYRTMLNKHAQELGEDEELDMHDDELSQSMEDASSTDDKKLSSLIKASIHTTEDIFSQFDFPLLTPSIKRQPNIVGA